MCDYGQLDCCKMLGRPFGSNGFVIKATILLVIICAPGNLLTTILLYKQWSGIDEMTNVKNQTENMFGEVTTENDLKPQVSMKLCFYRLVWHAKPNF